MPHHIQVSFSVYAEGMKKIALMALGLTGVLASCGGSVSTETPPRTDFRLSEKVTYDNGSKSLNAGTYLICDNLRTGVEVTVDTAPGVDRFFISAKGLKEGEVKNFGPYKADADGKTRVTFAFDPRMAPLDLEAQAIVVNPKPVKNVNVLGFTNMGVRTLNANGSVISEPNYSQFVFPVVDSCAVL
ncbi:hypothetical protein [Deinococcus radiophilus]|nr:hypothetical protein [Deinococcus radiophilus]